MAGIYVATGSYSGAQSKDTFSTGAAAWALGVHHTLNLNFLPQTYFNPSPLWIVHGAHGALVTNRFPGAILLATPLYALIGGHYNSLASTMSAAICAAGACAVLFKVLLRLQPRNVALGGTAIFAFATSNWTVSGRELWEHSGSELLIVIGMLALLSRRWAWSGLAFGTAVLFRAHLGFGDAAVWVGILWLERQWRPALRFALASTLGPSIYLVWNWIVYGHFTVSGGYSDVAARGVGLRGFLDNIAGTLVSPERGVLICSPVLILAILGLRSAWRSSPNWCVSLPSPDWSTSDRSSG